jgi:large subunit ribosomal protein L22
MEEFVAVGKNIKMSPRKMRLVADSVKKSDLQNALAQLVVLNKRAADPIRKALESAVANATHNFGKEKASLTIKDIIVTEGISYKRYHYASRGRIHPYKRRTSHVKVVLVQKEEKAKKIETKEAMQEEKTVEKKGIRSRLKRTNKEVKKEEAK